MSEDYKLQASISLPPRAQFAKGDMLNVRADTVPELANQFTGLYMQIGFDQAAAVQAANSRIAEFLEGAPPATQEQAAANVGQAFSGTTPAPAPQPPVIYPGQAPPVGVATPAYPPQAPPQAPPAPAAPAAAKPLTPIPPGSQMGAPCTKCQYQTFWQPGGVRFDTKEPYEGYWRCPNAPNHPKAR